MASDVLNTRFNDLDIFYDFAERCNDDYEVMAQILSKDSEKSPSHIKFNLEKLTVRNYIEAMKQITDKEIQKAIKEIEK